MGEAVKQILNSVVVDYFGTNLVCLLHGLHVQQRLRTAFDEGFQFALTLDRLFLFGLLFLHIQNVVKHSGKREWYQASKFVLKIREQHSEG